LNLQAFCSKLEAQRLNCPSVSVMFGDVNHARVFPVESGRDVLLSGRFGCRARFACETLGERVEQIV
jgi:hypothetical protein